MLEGVLHGVMKDPALRAAGGPATPRLDSPFLGGKIARTELR